MFSPFSSTAVGALDLFTFRPQCTVHNLRISELGVPGLYICWSKLSLKYTDQRRFQGGAIGAKPPPPPGPVKSIDFKGFSCPNGC